MVFFGPRISFDHCSGHENIDKQKQADDVSACSA